MALLDDVFSGLDIQTAQTIFENLFGKQGLLRQWKTTTILATQSGELTYNQYWYFVVDCQAASFLPTTDHIICLSKGKNISEQGSFRSLENAGGYVQSLLEGKTTHEASEDTIEEDVIEQTNQPKQTVSQQQDEQEDSRRQRGDSTVYRYYFSSTGGLFMVALLGLEIVWAFLESFPSLSSPLRVIARQC